MKTLRPFLFLARDLDGFGTNLSHPKNRACTNPEECREWRRSDNEEAIGRRRCAAAAMSRTRIASTRRLKPKLGREAWNPKWIAASSSTAKKPNARHSPKPWNGTGARSCPRSAIPTKRTSASIDGSTTPSPNEAWRICVAPISLRIEMRVALQAVRRTRSDWSWHLSGTFSRSRERSGAWKAS